MRTLLSFLLLLGFSVQAQRTVLVDRDTHRVFYPTNFWIENFTNSATVTRSVDANGRVVLTVIGSGSATNATQAFVEGTYRSVINFIDGSRILVTYTGTNATFDINPGTLTTNDLSTAAHSALRSGDFSGAVVIGDAIKRNLIDIGASTVLTNNRNYTVTLSASRTFTFSGAQSEGDEISLFVTNSVAGINVGFPVSVDGYGGNIITNVYLPTIGNYEFSWVRKKGVNSFMGPPSVLDFTTTVSGLSITFTNLTGTNRWTLSGTPVGIPSDGDKGSLTVSGSGLTWLLDANSVGASELSPTSVIAGSYTNAIFTVDADGRLTFATNGVAGGSLADGNYGDVTVSSSGTVITINANSVALSTDTTGVYVQTAQGTTGHINASGNGSEGAVVTLSIPPAFDISTNVSFRMPNSAAPSVTLFGHLAGDNDYYAASRGAPLFFDGTSTVALVGVLITDTPSDGQYPRWNTGGTITWETIVSGTSYSASDGITLTGTNFTLNTIWFGTNTMHKTVAWWEYDFQAGGSSSPPFTFTGGNSGTSFEDTAYLDHPWVWTCSTGSLTNGYHGAIQPVASFIIPNTNWMTFEWTANTPAVSTDVDAYVLHIGANDNSGGDATDGVYARYTHLENSGNWVLVTRLAGTETVGTSSVAYASGWNTLRFQLSGTNSAVMFVNGSPAVTNTANIPGGSARTRLSAKIMKLGGSTGTTARSLILDHVKVGMGVNR